MNIRKHFKAFSLFLALTNTINGFSATGEITEKLINPVRIVWMSDNTGKYIQNADELLKDFNGQISVADNKYATLYSKEEHQASILLDFGKEIHGGLKITSSIREYMNSVNLRIRFGESVTEAMSDVTIANNPENPTNEHSLRDFNLAASWLGSVQCGNTGFRFVRIDLLDKGVEYRLRNVSAISRIRDIEDKGSFQSNNERLNQIWNTGAYTVKLNMQEYIWDGIKRDRLVWIGDMHPEVMTINNAFGNHEVVYRTLDFARNDTPLPGWMNGMCSYSLWWLIIQKDLYMYQGNLDYLKQQQSYIKGLVKQIDARIDDNGVEHLDGTRFLDWPTSESPEIIHSGLQAMSLMAMEAAAQIGDFLKDDELKQIAQKNIEKLQKVRVGTYGNSQAAAMSIISGLSKNNAQDCEVILKNGVSGFSTFYGYYMLEALAANGKYKEAMDIISNYWGAMLDLGGTTFWEDLKYSDVAKSGRIDELVPQGKYDIHSGGGAYCYKGLRLSLCHGWASGPTSWMTKHVLGVTPVEPGCKVLEIDPHLGDLTSVKGTFPTPMGVVSISHKKGTDGKIISDIKAPKGVKVRMKK